MHFWSFWAKYCHFLHILSNARPKTNGNKVPGWVFRYVGNKTFDFSSKKKDFLPKNDQIWPKIGIFGQFGPGHAGFFGALLVGRLVVVARGLYLARHLFTFPARALRALGLLLADGTPTGGRGEDFLNRQPNFFTETAVTPERKVEKSFPRWEINRHVEG